MDVDIGTQHGCSPCPRDMPSAAFRDSIAKFSRLGELGIRLVEKMKRGHGLQIGSRRLEGSMHKIRGRSGKGLRPPPRWSRKGFAPRDALEVGNYVARCPPVVSCLFR